MLGSLLMSPMTGLTFILREIAQAVDDARDADRRGIMADLQELHRLIERGTITDAEFDAREGPLLDRLDALSGNGSGG
jgi:Gas vesicle protein G